MHTVLRTATRAFSRIDALSAVATFLGLSLLFVLSTGMSRSHSDAAVCLSTMRQLTRAWQLYTLEHDDLLPFNMGVTETEAEVSSGRYRNWVNNVMSWGSAQSEYGITNRQQALKGGVGPYLDGHTESFGCVLDRYVSPQQHALGWTERMRSRSMNAYLGAYSHWDWDPTASGRNPFYSSYRQILRLASVANPGRTFVFIEEHPDSINDGYFLNGPGVTGWGDIPGSLHGGAGAIGFVDGHVELHWWEGRMTKPPVQFRYVSRAFDDAGRMDFDWYCQRVPLELAQ
jgi:prepilin-type processing-associated H-X9-DG protein